MPERNRQRLGRMAIAGMMPIAIVASIWWGIGAVAHGGDSGETEALYGKKCASCHGEDGRGNEKLLKMLKVEMSALDLLDEASLAKSPEEWNRVTTEGEGKMPAYGEKLTSEQIAAINAYVRDLAPN